jgi:chaperonin GroES
VSSIQRDDAAELEHGLIIQVHADRYLIKNDGAAAQVGKIIIPEKFKEAPTTGVIIAVGASLWQGAYKKGDKVVYGKYAGTPLKFKKQEGYLRVITDGEILCRMVEGNAEIEES